MSITKKLSNLLESEELPPIKTVLASPDNYELSSFNEKTKKMVREQIADKSKLEQGQPVTVRFENTDNLISFNIEYADPDKGVPVDSTRIRLVNYAFYTGEEDTFSVPPGKLLELSEKPDLEEKTEVDSPRAMANVLNQNFGLNVRHYEPDDLWMCGGYYFSFDS